MNVVFNAKGFHHLQYKSDRTPRKIIEKIYKLRLVPLIPVVIKNSVHIDQERNLIIKKRRKGKIEEQNGKSYSISAFVGRNNVSIRVILIKINNGNCIFWSVMKN